MNFWKINMKGLYSVLLCWLVLTMEMIFKAFGDFDQAGKFQESVSCLHLIISCFCDEAMYAWKSLSSDRTVIITRVTIVSWITCDGTEENCSSEQSVESARVLISYFVKLYKKIWAEAMAGNKVKVLVCLPGNISYKNNSLTIYFIAAKLLGKGFRRKTCIFTMLWAIFLEMGTPSAHGMR